MIEEYWTIIIYIYIQHHSTIYMFIIQLYIYLYMCNYVRIYIYMYVYIEVCWSMLNYVELYWPYTKNQHFVLLDWWYNPCNSASAWCWPATDGVCIVEMWRDVTIKACHPGKCGYNASFMNHLWGYDWIIVGIFPRVVKHGLLEFPLFSSMIFPLTKEKRAFSRMFDDAIFGILTYSHGIPVWYSQDIPRLDY